MISFQKIHIMRISTNQIIDLHRLFPAVITVSQKIQGIAVIKINFSITSTFPSSHDRKHHEKVCLKSLESSTLKPLVDKSGL